MTATIGLFCPFENSAHDGGIQVKITIMAMARNTETLLICCAKNVNCLPRNVRNDYVVLSALQLKHTELEIFFGLLPDVLHQLFYLFDRLSHLVCQFVIPDQTAGSALSFVNPVKNRCDPS